MSNLISHFFALFVRLFSVRDAARRRGVNPYFVFSLALSAYRRGLRLHGLDTLLEQFHTAKPFLASLGVVKRIHSGANITVPSVEES